MGRKEESDGKIHYQLGHIDCGLYGVRVLCGHVHRSGGMTKRDLIRDMQTETGTSFPNITQLAKYMGMSRDRVRGELVDGLDYIGSGKAKQYFVADVAERILQQRSM